MSSVQDLRNFINERLTAAAVEILSVFEQTIIRYEKEIDRQQRLLENVCKPETQTHTAELPQLQDYKDEEGFSAGLFCNQETSLSPDDQHPDPPQIKEELQNICIQDGEQHVLKQETDTLAVTPNHGESNPSGQELEGDQLLSHSSSAMERLEQKGSDVDSRSTGNTQLKSVSPISENQCNTNLHSKSVICDFCGKAFKKVSIMKRHLKIHTGEKTHSCEMCGKGFRDSSVLLRHMRTHTGETPYACTTCGKRFKDKSVMLRHMRIHSGEKPYACKICGKCFKDNSSVLRHMKIHSDEKLHACSICGKRFICKTRLSTHMKIHTSERPYSCKTCGKSFKFNFKLSYHERTHTNEKLCFCDTCGKAFTDPSILKRHVRIHTNDRPHSCQMCGKSFRDNYKLLNHMRTHTNEKL